MCDLKDYFRYWFERYTPISHPDWDWELIEDEKGDRDV